MTESEMFTFPKENAPEGEEVRFEQLQKGLRIQVGSDRSLEIAKSGTVDLGPLVFPKLTLYKEMRTAATPQRAVFQPAIVFLQGSYSQNVTWNDRREKPGEWYTFPTGDYFPGIKVGWYLWFIESMPWSTVVKSFYSRPVVTQLTIDQG